MENYVCQNNHGEEVRKESKVYVEMHERSSRVNERLGMTDMWRDRGTHRVDVDALFNKLRR